MPELTPELLLKLHPGVYWAVRRAGFAEAKSDPNTRKEIAEQYLKSQLLEGSSSATAQPSSAPPMARPAAQPQPVQIAAVQERVNKALGLSTADFEKYSHETPSQLDPMQAQVNKALGLSDEDYLKGTNGR